MTKRVLIAALVIFGATVLVARADTVTYSTSYNLGNPTTGLWNGINLEFTGVNHATVNTPAQSSLGAFTITGWLFSGTDTYRSVPFDLTITQYRPITDGNTATFTSFINGAISFGQSSATVAFDQPFVTIGNVIYTLTQQTYALMPDGGGFLGLDPGYTEIDAQITTSEIAATPEPASMVLLGTGLLILAGAIRGAKRSRVALQHLST